MMNPDDQSLLKAGGIIVTVALVIFTVCWLIGRIMKETPKPRK